MSYMERLKKEIDGLEENVKELNERTAREMDNIDRLNKELAEYRRRRHANGKL